MQELKSERSLSTFSINTSKKDLPQAVQCGEEKKGGSKM